MTGQLIRFEWRYHTRQMSFPAAALLFFVFGFALAATGFGPANVAINSPFSVMQSVGVLSLLSLFILAVFCANAIVRDRDHRMEEIVFSTAVEKLQLLVARFSGAYFAIVTAFCFAIAGMIAATLLASHDLARVAPFDPLRYLWAFTVFALPNLFFSTAVIFAISALTRSLLAGSIGAVVIYAVYLAASVFTNSPLMASSSTGGGEASFAAVLLDPFGLSPFFELTRYWTAAERNTRLVPLTGVLLANRLLWIAAGAATTVLAHRFFTFGLLGTSTPHFSRKKVITDTPDASSVAARYVPAATASGAKARLLAFLSSMRLEVRSYVTTLPFVVLTLLWAALAFSEMISAVDSAEYGSALYATTPILLGALEQPLHLIALVVLIYVGAEMLWQDRVVRMNGIVLATPTGSALFVLSKWAALSVIAMTLVAVGAVVALMTQFMRGWSDVGVTALLGYLWFASLPLLIFAAAVVLVHAVAPNKYVGIVSTVALALLMKASDLVGLAHPLLRFATAPPVKWSDFYGFGPFAATFHALMAHWALLGALALAIATLTWRRGGVMSPRPATRLTIAALTIAFLLSNALLYRAFNIVNDYDTAAEALRWRADYERKYGAYEKLPQPRLVAIDSDVEIHPDAAACRLSGSLTLRNETNAAIDHLLVSIRPDAENATLRVEGATIVEGDERFRHYVYRLGSPLAAGAVASVGFDLTFASSPFAQGGPDTSVTQNGSLITSSRVLPVIGYRKGYEIQSPSDRRRLGLPQRELGDVYDVSDIAQERVALDVTISTDADQVPVTTGELQREWVDAQRRYRQYKTYGAVSNGFSFASARYAVARGDSRGIPIEVFHHPRHSMNVARILETAKAAVEELEGAFGAYPHQRLRIVEVPSPGNEFGGYAHAEMILLNEKRALLVDARDERRIDLVARRVAHEVAHQWWGRHLTPALAPGAPTLAESLTKYSELLVLRRMYGDDVVRRVLETELDLYLTGRTRDESAEVPLVSATTQAYIPYAKGSIVMHAIEHLLGRETLQSILRQFIEQESAAGMKPTAHALFGRFSAAATPEQLRLIDEWTRRVVLYDLKMVAATARPRSDGRFEVRVDVDAAKFESDVRLPFEEEIEVGLFAEHPDHLPLESNVIARGQHRLRDGRNRISLVVDRLPAFAIVDPYVLRLDRSPGDNAREVTHQSASAAVQ